MNLDFLKNFGQMAGRGIKRGVGQLGEVDGDEGAMQALRRPQIGPGGTAGFNPNAPLMKAPPIGSDAGLMRPSSFGAEQIPSPNMPPQFDDETPMPPNFRYNTEVPSGLSRNPVSASDHSDFQSQRLPMRSTVGSAGGALSDLQQRDFDVPVSVTPQQTQMIGERPLNDIRIPDFLGTPGSTKDYNPMNKAEYAYQTQYMKDGRIPRRWQDIALSALHGAGQGFAEGGIGGAIGGAAAAGSGAAISPLHSRQYRFDREQRPRLMADEQRTQKRQSDDIAIQGRNADIAGTQARTAATIAGTKDIELERRKTESLIKLNDAKRQAVATGQARIVEIEDENGQVRIVRVNNDGSVDLGNSGRAAMNDDRIQSREKISGNQISSREKVAGQAQKGAMDRARVQQGGANYRTGQTQSGQNARQKERLGAQYGSDTYVPPVGSVPYGPPADSGGGSRREEFIKRSVEAGHSRAAAEAEAKKRGY